MEITKSTRLPEIDVARGLGIILVVLGHNWLFITHYPTLNQAIYTFHVPLFFFLSGVIFKPEKDINFLIIKRLKSLLKPYFVVLIVYELYRLASGKSESILPFFGVLYATGQSISLTPLWFLPHLFIVTIVVNVLIKYAQEKLNPSRINILIIGILILGFYVLHASNNANLYESISFKVTAIPLGLPLSLDFLLISTAFFLSGYVNSNAIKLITGSYLRAFVPAMVFITVCIFFEPRLDLNSRIYNNFIYTSVAAFAGIWMSIAISKVISERVESVTKVLSYIGSASLFILIFHGIIQGILAHKFNVWIPDYPYLSIFLSAGFAIGGSCALFAITNRFTKLRSILQ